jgi:hypothetical protein
MHRYKHTFLTRTFKAFSGEIRTKIWRNSFFGTKSWGWQTDVSEWWKQVKMRVVWMKRFQSSTKINFCLNGYSCMDIELLSLVCLCLHETGIVTNLQNLITAEFDVLLTVHLGIILVNDQLDAQFFFVYVCSKSLNVSSTHVLIIRRINCINATSGICDYVGDRLVWRSLTWSDVYQMSYWYN